MDETVSVILHTKSPLMQRPTKVMQNLLYFLQNAGQVILMDASLDDRTGFNFVACLSRILAAPPRWIKNTYVRAPLRKAFIYVCRSGGRTDEMALQSAAVNKTIACLKEGHNIYAPCTQLAHVKRLACRVAGLAMGITVVTTTSETPDVDKEQFAENLDEILKETRLWASSPTISAGISFELEHFSRIVGFAKNDGERGATVDCFVQQLGRVRDLGEDGELHLYVSDNPIMNEAAGPLDDLVLDTYLQVR